MNMVAAKVQNLAKNFTKRCRVIVCGVGGRMGAIRTGLVYANPRFELCGVCDVNMEAADRIASKYSVSISHITGKDHSITTANTKRMTMLVN